MGPVKLKYHVTQNCAERPGPAHAKKKTILTYVTDYVVYMKYACFCNFTSDTDTQFPFIALICAND